MAYTLSWLRERGLEASWWKCSKRQVERSSLSSPAVFVPTHRFPCLSSKMVRTVLSERESGFETSYWNLVAE